MDHQQKFLDFSAKVKYCILGDEVGLGKTISALAVAKEYGKKTLVICPAYLVKNWVKEADRFGATIDITSYQSGSYKLSRADYDVIIIDESHYLKNMEAKRTKNTVELVKKILPDRLMLLSATSLLKNAGDFWVPIVLMDLDAQDTNGAKITSIYKNEYKFKTTFCNEIKYVVKGRMIRNFKGHKNLDKLKSLLVGKYVKRRADKVLDLPEFRFIDINLDQKDVEGLDSEFNESKGGGAKTTAKARSAELKVPYTLELIKDLIQSGVKQIVVFSDHVKPVSMIAEGLKGHKVASITGSVSVEDRQNVVDEFQKGGVEIVVATIGSLSTGFTLTSANVMVFNDLSWTGAYNRQARGRIRRIGQKNACLYYHVFYGKMDELINKTVEEKEKLLDIF